MVRKIESRYHIKYKGKVMPLREFADMIGVDYERLRRRLARGCSLESLPLKDEEYDSPEPKREGSGSGMYTLEELADMYSKFRNEEDAQYILADLACLPRRGKAVRRLQTQIENYIEEKRKEIRQPPHG